MGPSRPTAASAQTSTAAGMSSHGKLSESGSAAMNPTSPPENAPNQTMLARRLSDQTNK